MFQQYYNTISASPVTDHLPGFRIIYLSLQKSQSASKLFPSTITEVNNMNNILAKDIQDNSASAGQLFLDGQQTEPLLNIKDVEEDMNS